MNLPNGEPFHYVCVDVTVEAAVVKPDDHILGDNLVDATVAFGWRISTPPTDATDEAINAGLTKQMANVLALIQTSLTLNGWVAMGQVDERMGEHSTPTGEVRHTRPVSVRLVVPDEGNAIHD